MRDKLYGHNRARDLDHYAKHLLAMTAEQLHSKADIACELAWRDEQKDIMQQDFNDAINYASNTADDAALFLTTWREGDWETLRKEWPDFKLPRIAK